MILWKDFFINDTQFTLKKGLWNYWYQSAYLPIPRSDPDDVPNETPKTTSFLGAWAHPFLQPATLGDEEDEPFKSGAFILLCTSGLIEMLHWMLDCLVSALLEFPCAWYTHYAYLHQQENDREEISEHQKSYCFMIILKRLVSLYFLIPQIKWLWRITAIQLPSWGLAQSRLGFMLGAGVTLALIIGVLFFTGGTASLLPVIVPIIAGLLHSLNAACGVAGLWMAAHWFFGLSCFSFMAPVIQTVLMTICVATITSIIGNITACFMSLLHGGLNKLCKNYLNDCIKGVDKAIDKTIQRFLHNDDTALTPSKPKHTPAREQGEEQFHAVDPDLVAAVDTERMVL